MKHLFSALLVLAVFSTTAKNKPIIYGCIKGLPDTKLYLEADVKWVDSCTSANGSFRLEVKNGSIPASCMVYYKNSKGEKEPFSPNFIAENNQITFTGEFNNRKSYKIGNSEETRIFHCMLRDTYKTDMYLRQAIDSANRDLAINKTRYIQERAEYKEIIRKYAETYPKSFAVAKIISFSQFYYKSEDYETMLNNELKNNPYIQKFRRFFALKKGITVPLTVRDSNGTKTTLNRTLKRNTLLVSWFVGCAPCREELAYLEKVDRSSLPFDIVTLSTDTDREKWKGYLGKLRWNKWNYLWDVALARKTGIYKYPTCILVDKNGVVIDPEFNAYSLGKK